MLITLTASLPEDIRIRTELSFMCLPREPHTTQTLFNVETHFFFFVRQTAFSSLIQQNSSFTLVCCFIFPFMRHKQWLCAFLTSTGVASEWHTNMNTNEINKPRKRSETNIQPERTPSSDGGAPPGAHCGYYMPPKLGHRPTLQAHQFSPAILS